MERSEASKAGPRDDRRAPWRGGSWDEAGLRHPKRPRKLHERKRKKPRWGLRKAAKFCPRLSSGWPKSVTLC